MAEPEAVEHRLGVTSVFGMATRQPIVQLEIPSASTGPVMRPGKEGPEPTPDMIGVQLTPATARDFALNVLVAAESALGDGFLLTFLERELEIPIVELGSLLLKFRGYRTQHEHEGA